MRTGGLENIQEHFRMIQNGRVCHACFVYTSWGVSGQLSRVHGVSWDGLERSWIHSLVSLVIPGGFIGGLVRVMCVRVHLHVTPTGSTLWERSADLHINEVPEARN